MQYFLFFPTGVFKGKYTKHIYCSLNSPMSFLLLQRFLSYELSRDNNHYMLHHFLLIIFPTGFKGVLATYQTLYSFSHRVFRGDFLKMKMINILKGKHLKPKNQKMNNRASVDKAKAPFV